MKLAKLTFITICFLLATGCSSQYAVNFDSYPQGATLVCGGKNFGYTPKKLYYDKSVKKQEILDLSNCSANWVSGARKNYGTVSVQKFPEGVRVTPRRPNDSGFQQDAEFALKVQQMQLLERQAVAAENSVYQQQQQNNKTTTCLTNFGVTTCM